MFIDKDGGKKAFGMAEHKRKVSDRWVQVGGVFIKESFCVNYI